MKPDRLDRRLDRRLQGDSLLIARHDRVRIDLGNLNTVVLRY